MSDETKNKTAAETVAENIHAIGLAVAENASTAEEVAQAAAVLGAAPAKPSAAAKPKAKAKTEAASDASALKAVGLEACRRHNLPRVWVTSDGQAFAQENDAKAHALNLDNKEILKVGAK